MSTIVYKVTFVSVSTWKLKERTVRLAKLLLKHVQADLYNRTQH